MVLGQDALGLVGGHDRQAKVLGDLPEPCGGAALDDAPAGKEDRALGPDECGVDLGHGLRRRCRRLGQLDRPGHGYVGGVGLDVHGHRDEHRSWPASGSEGKGLGHDARELVHPRHLPQALGHGLEQRGQVGPGLAVDLLQHAATEHVGVDIAGEDEHRRRVDVGRGDADRGVDRARADRRHDRHGLASHPEVGVREVRRRLLVPNLQEGRPLDIDEGVDHGQAAMPGDAGHVLHPVGRQMVGVDLSARAHVAPDALLVLAPPSSRLTRPAVSTTSGAMTASRSLSSRSAGAEMPSEAMTPPIPKTGAATQRTPAWYSRSSTA
jgi:hypothetical protein